MEVSIHKEMKEVDVITYIAEDGAKFTTAMDCRKHEAKIQREKKYAQVIKLLVLDDEEGKIPCDGGENYESHVWEWYKVANASELEILNGVFNTTAKVYSYPEFICIERNSEDSDEGYSQTLSGCIDYVKAFFSYFGYTVSFQASEMEP
jgi:hypothetical protein